MISLFLFPLIFIFPLVCIHLIYKIRLKITIDRFIKCILCHISYYVNRLYELLLMTVYDLLSNQTMYIVTDYTRIA